MIWINKAWTERVRPARLATGVAVAAVLALGLSAGTANARWDHDDHRDWHHGWTGGYREAPPVVYGGPGYYGYAPPPVVYGPGIGINVPGVSVGIRG